MLALLNLNSKLDIFSFKSLLSNKDGISPHPLIPPSPHLPIPLSPCPHLPLRVAPLATSRGTREGAVAYHLPIPLSPSPHDFATRTLSPSLRYPAPSTTIFFPGCKPLLISTFPPLRISPVSTF